MCSNFHCQIICRPLLASWQKRWRLWRWRAVCREGQHLPRRTGRTGGRRSWTRWPSSSCRTTCSRRSRRSRTSPRSSARSAQSLRPAESEFNFILIILLIMFAIYRHSDQEFLSSRVYCMSSEASPNVLPSDSRRFSPTSCQTGRRQNWKNLLWLSEPWPLGHKLSKPRKPQYWRLARLERKREKKMFHNFLLFHSLNARSSKTETHTI